TSAAGRAGGATGANGAEGASGTVGTAGTNAAARSAGAASCAATGTAAASAQANTNEHAVRSMTNLLPRAFAGDPAQHCGHEFLVPASQWPLRRTTSEPCYINANATPLGTSRECAK